MQPPSVSRRSKGLPLLWKLFLTNAAVLAVATLVLAFGPFTVSVPVKVTEFVVLLAGLLAMLAINMVLLRRTLHPLRDLTETMGRVDLLEPGRRVEVKGAGPDVQRLTTAFNAMIERLEDERRESTRMALTVQEGERQRIARELHDEIGQTLTAMLLQIQSIHADAPENLRPELDELRESARSGAQDVRRIAQRLRPEALEELGLQSALVALSDAFAEQTHVRVARQIETDLPLSPEDELVIYRVAQEALTNIARHAGATTAALELRLGGDNTVALRVRDNGRGFAADRRNGTYGLRGMRERAMLIGATLHIESSPEDGTEVLLNVPRRTS
jgi:two-component system sensor histidine kinase UhpB